MNIKKEDVFLIVLADVLAHNRERPGTGVALAALDVTNEIMSVVGKVSKSNAVVPPHTTKVRGSP